MRNLGAALIAEFLGTMILIILGDGVVGSAVLLEKAGGWMVITTGWALAVTIAVYVSGKVSGGHVNPAVTLALAVRREFPSFISAQGRRRSSRTSRRRAAT